jgi:hypothetical protein
MELFITFPEGYIDEMRRELLYTCNKEDLKKTYTWFTDKPIFWSQD